MVDHIHRGVAERGFADVRPAHGFVFVRISAGDATLVDVASHLGVTKQAASQLVKQLVERGYVTRQPDARDGRARLLVLTERGWACTHAADQAAQELADRWEGKVGAKTMNSVRRTMRSLIRPGPVRPAW